MRYNVPSCTVITVHLTDQQTILPASDRLTDAVRHVLETAGVEQAEISLVLVDNDEIQRLNVEFLEHDYATDALSFLLDDGPDGLEGEIIVSSEMAQQRASEFAWRPEDELLLYVIHATLHLVGYDDTADDVRAEMRAAERRHLAHFGISPVDPEAASTDLSEHLSTPSES